MAPLGMVSMMGWLSSPEVGIISIVAFLVLSITLLALCARCKRNNSNAYDVSAPKLDTTGGANGTVGTKTEATGDLAYSTWRDHKSMPANTLERPKAHTK